MKGICVLLILPIVFVYSKNSYIVTVPKQIRAGSVANVCVNILRRGRGRTTITATLITFENKTLSRSTSDVRPRNSQVLKLKVPPNAKVASNYRIQVSASGLVSFTKTARNVKVTKKASSIFIQLSRPLYKPGDMVQFRAVGTFPNLKPVKAPLDIVVYDPNRNRIKQYLGVRSPYGVFGGDLQLSSLTTHGLWQIEVKQLRETVSKTFEVKQFVLPKFEVNVIVPSQQLTTDIYFTFTITAIYTFGKPVIGDVNITIGHISRWTRNDRKITKQFKITGKAVRILMTEVQSRLGTYIPIFAEVTETITGNKANASGTARIYTYPEKMQFSQNQPRIFKPGLDYTYILRVTNQDDTPLDRLTGKVNITVYYDVRKQFSPKQKLENQFQVERRFGPRFSPLPPTEQKLLYAIQENIPKDGVLVLKASFPKDAVRGRIVARYRKTSAYLHLERARAASNNFIQIRIKDGTKAQKVEIKNSYKVHLNLAACTDDVWIALMTVFDTYQKLDVEITQYHFFHFGQVKDNNRKVEYLEKLSTREISLSQFREKCICKSEKKKGYRSTQIVKSSKNSERNTDDHSEKCQTNESQLLKTETQQLRIKLQEEVANSKTLEKKVTQLQEENSKLKQNQKEIKENEDLINNLKLELKRQQDKYEFSLKSQEEKSKVILDNEKRLRQEYDLMKSRCEVAEDTAARARAQLQEHGLTKKMTAKQKQEQKVSCEEAKKVEQSCEKPTFKRCLENNETGTGQNVKELPKTESVPIKKSRRLDSKEITKYTVDEKVMAYWNSDNTWYEATILEEKKTGYLIEFTLDKIKKVVKANQLKKDDSVLSKKSNQTSTN